MKKEPIILIFIIIITGLVVSFLINKIPKREITTNQVVSLETPEKIILGAWRKSSAFDESGLEVPIIKGSKYAVSELGFIKRNTDEYILNDYTKSTHTNIYELWDSIPFKIKNVNGEILSLAMVNDFYKIEVISKNEIIVSTFYSNGNDIRWKGRFFRIRTEEEEVDHNKPRTETETRQKCADIVNMTNESGIILPISCSIKISKNDTREVVLAISQEGKLTISRGNKTLLSLDGSHESTIDYDFLDNKSVPMLPSHILNLVDITYDGYLDLQVKTGCGAYQCTSEFFAYNINTDSYDLILSGTEPDINKNTKTIFFHAKSRGIGDIFSEEEYTFIKNKYVLTKACEQNLLDVNVENSDYIYKCSELRNEKMVQTIYNVLNYKDVRGR